MSGRNDIASFGLAAGIMWIGRSGRRYVLQRVLEEGHVLVEGALYALVNGNAIAWAGTAQNLIEDQASRARFRRAAGEGAVLFSLPAPDEELACMTLVWDLEGTRRNPGRNAA
ncbi:hypothetical protein [Pelagibacterium lentulum]|uniref:Uncharacterized protein n=1 Tax=Pelagibacterium lentulum TaxID=2029865 RepID=A0A916R705_9HYPH|nr:hypothetical protein [Pelagibacterium lentulum]GGA35264.1 hypothetical protein GCM10011499_00710 [Pelagibacterium lentulum]